MPGLTGGPLLAYGICGESGYDISITSIVSSRERGTMFHSYISRSCLALFQEMQQYVLPGNTGGHLSPGPWIRVHSNKLQHDHLKVLSELVGINKGAILNPEESGRVNEISIK